MLQAFAEGDLGDDERAGVCDHLDGCDECRLLLGAVVPAVSEAALLCGQQGGADPYEAGAPSQIGRYLVRKPIGQGGMGTVYEAYDPALERIVAVKVLRKELGSAAYQERLRTEALAMAKLSHAHVVPVHDVGEMPPLPGERHGRIFVVMALVRGASLRRWLLAEPRSLPEVCAVFTQAARGLAAAHEVSLCHRDFKPDNVLVETDGRALVGDFGLALSGEADATLADEGTRAYMAPEQASGERADARSDQYAFGVSLREALETSRAMRNRRDASGGVLPRWLEQIVSRATAHDPAARYPTMRALANALELGPLRAAKRRLAIGVSLIMAIFLTLGAVGWRSSSVAVCRDVEEVNTLWNRDTKARVESAFNATKSPLAAPAFELASVRLDAYASLLRAAEEQACAARAKQSEAATQEKRRLCLAEGHNRLRSVVGLFQTADAKSIEQTAATLAVLPPVDRCSDALFVTQEGAPPPATEAAAVAAVRRALSDAEATLSAGRYDEGVKLAERAKGDAARTRFAPLMAQADYWFGMAHCRLGHTDACEQTLSSVAATASASDMKVLAARAWVSLAHFVGVEAKRYADGHRFLDYARMALEHLPGEVELEAERRTWLRALLLTEGRTPDALVASEDELRGMQATLGEHHKQYASALDGRASILHVQCKYADAVVPQEQACAILAKELGNAHPQFALCLGNLASLHAGRGDHVTALVLKERALALFHALPGHPNHIAMARRNKVRSLLELDRLDEAERELEAARGESSELSLELLRADLAFRRGDHDAALRLAESARSSTDDAESAAAYLMMARAFLAKGETAGAARTARLALHLVKRRYGEASCKTGEALALIAEARCASRDLEEGRVSRKLALEVWLGTQVPRAKRDHLESLCKDPIQ